MELVFPHFGRLPVIVTHQKLERGKDTYSAPFLPGDDLPCGQTNRDYKDQLWPLVVVRKLEHCIYNT